MTAYNGYPSWNQWNVSLWINNDESLYRFALSLVKQWGKSRASYMLATAWKDQKTPDGAKYNRTAIYNAIKDIL